MNTLGYAILGLIHKKEMSGYDLTKLFNHSITDFWNAKQSQIYPELAKLLKLGLLDYRVVVQGEVLEKKMYSITPEGKRELLRWMEEIEPDLPQYKDIFKLRIYFAENVSSSVLLHKFSRRRTLLVERLERYTTKFLEYLPENISEKELGDYLLLKGAIAQLKAHLAWIDESIDFLRAR